jgi:hypothetical protein
MDQAGMNGPPPAAPDVIAGLDRLMVTPDIMHGM